MRYVLFPKSAFFCVATVLSLIADGRCQLGNSTSILPETVHDTVQYGRAIGLGRYVGSISGKDVPSDCPHANERLSRLATVAGKPKGSTNAGLTESESQKRKQLVNAFNNFMECGEPGEDPDDLLNGTLVPWLMSNREVVVDLDDEKLQRIPPDTRKLANPLEGQPRHLTPIESNRPHSDITSPTGFVFGTIFAEDPTAKYEEGKPVYEISESEDEVKFVRRFKSLIPGSLTKPTNYFLDIAIDPGPKLSIRDGPRRIIIHHGDLQSVEWNLSPKLKRNWVDDDIADITIRGTIGEATEAGQEISGGSYGVDIPNDHFKIRKRSRIGLLKDGVTSFFKSVPGWISLIEAAVLAFVGFFRFGWLKGAPETPPTASSSEPSSSSS